MCIRDSPYAIKCTFINLIRQFSLSACRKTYRMLDLFENEYRGHFDYIVILCPTLRYNKNYLAKCWIKEDDCGFFIKPGDKLLEWIKQLSAFFSSKNTLFIVDNMIADETLDKTRGALLVIAISGSHREHSLRGCLLSDIRKSQSPCVTNLNSSSCGSQRIGELELIITENDVGSWDVGYIKERLENEKHACLYLRLEHPKTFQVLTSI